MSMQQIGRLAMRAEGEWWNASYAMPDTMEGALHLGSIRLLLVADKERKQAFMDLMRSAIGDMLKEATGADPKWKGEQPASEHERAGSA